MNYVVVVQTVVVGVWIVVAKVQLVVESVLHCVNKRICFYDIEAEFAAHDHLKLLCISGILQLHPSYVVYAAHPHPGYH